MRGVIEMQLLSVMLSIKNLTQAEEHKSPLNIENLFKLDISEFCLNISEENNFDSSLTELVKLWLNSIWLLGPNCKLVHCKAEG